MLIIWEMTFFLGLQVNQSPCGNFINQSNYVLEILKKYEMESCDPVGTPMEIKDKLDLDQNGTPVTATKYHSMIGALIYLTSSRPDIVHVTCLCARYQANPTEKHLKEVKGSFAISGEPLIRVFDTFKSTFGRAQFLGEKLVSWSSKKQDCTALSTAEADNVSLSACCAQVLWMRTQLTDYGFHFKKIPIYCDSKSIIAISCNPVQHSRTKHIAVRYHFITEHVEKAVMSSASSAVTYTSVYTDFELGRVFWRADEELSDGGSPRVIMYGYDGLPMLPVAPPSPDYIPDPEEPQTPPAPPDEDEHEPMFIQPHDPNFMPEPIYPEYIPLEEEHILLAEEQPLPPVVSPTAESLICV
nr:hypothetical protein [Tanacetum cinerariifolium]